MNWVAHWGSPDRDLRKVRGGLYLVRHESDATYTLGKSVRQSIGDRLNAHRKRYPNGSDVRRQHFHPFTEPVLCYDLRAWSPEDIASAEKCLYRAVAIKYPFIHESVFAAPRDEDFKFMARQVRADLSAIVQAKSENQQYDSAKAL